MDVVRQPVHREPERRPLHSLIQIAALALLWVLPVHAASQRVRVEGTRFARADGTRFAWRGITAFRLAEEVATGRAADAEKYLTWCAVHHITVVRVLAMAKHPFVLPPDKGVAALPALLALAAARGLEVEVVALADTVEYQFDINNHVTAIGRACSSSGNCFVEIANEPYHATQAVAVHDRAFLRKLRGLIPSEIPVALGAAERPEDSGGGDYATIHTARDTGEGGWGHVHALEALRGLPERLKMPIVSDEPIGAGEQLEPGRRDNDPARVRAAAKLTRDLGLGATFHYSGGIGAQIPVGRELACFTAWLSALWP